MLNCFCNLNLSFTLMICLVYQKLKWMGSSLLLTCVTPIGSELPDTKAAEEKCHLPLASVQPSSEYIFRDL